MTLISKGVVQASARADYGEVCGGACRGGALSKSPNFTPTYRTTIIKNAFFMDVYAVLL